MHIRNHRFRFYAVISFFFLFLFCLTARLFFIQFFRSRYLTNLAERQYNFFTELEPVRGTIFDRNLRPQATNIACDSLYAVPKQIKNKSSTALQLKAILNLDTNFFLERLSRKKSFIWLARKISPENAERIKELKIDGLGFIRETKRCYPNQQFASHTIGFAGLDNKGLEGLEALYDEYLRGESGWSTSIRDARQRPLPMGEKFVPAQDGYDLVLTIDEVIQFIAEYELDEIYNKSGAKGAAILVMDPNTGAVLALANRPSFDLNAGAAVEEARRNRVVSDYFEPGSVFKIVTAAAALEDGKVKEEDKIFCENGAYRVGNHTLHDHHPNGWLTFREVIVESSNIGTTKVAQLLGPEVIYKYAKLFGFGSSTGIDLPGEVSGVLKNPRQWSKTSIGAIPIGQEVCVTVLQLANMISCVANGGLLYKPYLLKAIKDKSGETIKEFNPVVIRRVISGETALRLRNILTDVVGEGTGRLAGLSNFKVGGKTGTAQKIDGGTYSHDKFIATFIGFVPADNPRLAMVVMVDEPQGTYFGGTVAAPVFKKVADKVLKYLDASKALEIARGN
ncbi:MAG: penicillin-binding transpeptidase domain-containing protein [Candidatus Omnitrophota bacterium]|nr:penicillin-binding transpeptidase domain-containing protein [Candidatus Omnitrophota bacterium]